MIDQMLLQDHVWESTKEAFETMISLPIERTEDTVELDASQLIICIITFSGSLEGAFSARCTTGCAEKIARTMLMMGPDDELSEPETCDAFGEVVNMLLGGLKTRINDTYPDIQISIPSTVKGLDIEPTMGRGAVKFDVTTAVEGEAMKLAVMCRSKE